MAYDFVSNIPSLLFLNLPGTSIRPVDPVLLFYHLSSQICTFFTASASSALSNIFFLI
jgi:hypothetical protein